MSKSAFEIIDNGLEMSLKEVLKTASRAENASLRAGANVIKKNVKSKLRASGINATHKSSKYIDRLIDAVRSTKPHDGEITVHILGTRKTKSGTYRLRFFESPKHRYNLKWRGKRLKKKRYVGTLAKYNGFFSAGISASKSEIEKKMDETIMKYIERAWNG